MAIDKTHKIPNAPNLRFPGFEGEWRLHRTTEYFEFKNGLNPEAKRFGNGIKFISVMDILNNRYITYDKIIGCVVPNTDDLEDFGVNYGDVLFQRSSETLEDVGRANVYLDKKTALFGGFVIRGKKCGDYNPLFFRYLLSSPNVRKSIIVQGAGAQHFNIGQEGLSKVYLNVPSKDEQKRISQLFDLIDDRIETQIGAIEDYKKLKGYLIDELIEQRGRTMKIGDVIAQRTERNRKNDDYTVLSVNNQKGFIAQSEQFEEREVASEDKSNYKIVRRDDFAYNPARINVGSIARLSNYDCGIVSPMYICFHSDERVLPEFLGYFFESRYFATEVDKRLEGSVRLCLSYDGLCDISIQIPNVENQQAIIQKLDAVSQKIALEEQCLDLFKQQKAYLLKNMFV